MIVTVRGVQINLTDYKAEYLNHTYVPGAIEVRDFWADKALTPLYFESRQKYDTLRVQVMFKNAELGDISSFGELLKRCDIQIEHAFSAGKIYECVLAGSAVKKESQRIHSVIYTFNCIIFGAYHEVLLKTTETNTLEILGAKETEAIITIENNTSSVITETGIVGFIVKNLAVGEKIIIDGIKKTVTNNGENVFNRVEFFNFPRFSPGEHEITVTGGADITIAYRERW